MTTPGSFSWQAASLLEVQQRSWCAGVRIMNGTEAVEIHQFKHQALLSQEKLLYDFLNESFSFPDRMLVCYTVRDTLLGSGAI